MRRLPLVCTAFALTLSACTEAPKPEKATDLEAIEKADAAPAAGDQLPPIPDGPIAVVGGKPIARELFTEVYELKLKKYKDRGREIPRSADRRYRKSIAERLIWHEVLQQEADKLGVTYDKDELAEREAMQKRGIKDWDRHLERRGETEASLRAMYVAELLERAILDKSGTLTVTDEEVDGEYEKIRDNYKSDKERVRASHILIGVGDDPEARPEPGEKPPEVDPATKKAQEDAALAKANEVYAKATAPDADFDALAREYSTGPSAPKGGDLGIFTADRMVEEFSEAAFKLKPGQISKPVKTKFGYHVIKLTGRYAPGTLPKEALVDQIRQRLEQRKLHMGRRDLKERLMKETTVVNHIESTLGPDTPAPARKPVKTHDLDANGPVRKVAPIKVDAASAGAPAPSDAAPPADAKLAPKPVDAPAE